MGEIREDGRREWERSEKMGGENGRDERMRGGENGRDQRMR